MRNRVVHLFLDESLLLDERALTFLLSQENPMDASRRVVELVGKLDAPPLVLGLSDVQGMIDEKGGAKSAVVMVRAPAEKGVADLLPTLPTGLDGAFAKGQAQPKVASEEKVKDRTRQVPDVVKVPPTVEPPKADPPVTRAPPPPRPASDPECAMEVLLDVTGNSTCSGCISDFAKYFQDRFNRLRRLLINRREMFGALPVSALATRSGTVKTVGMVMDRQKTTKGGMLFGIEDQTGQVKVLSSPGRDTPLDIVTDEVVGVVGSLNPSKDLIYADQIVRPEIPVRRKGHRAGRDLHVAFVSDVHVGSNTFLDQQWDGFMDFLNGRLDTSNGILDTLEYIIMPGDLVDGIGVYPNQLDELLIPDIYRQYEALAELLKDVPDHIEVILIPGNHDAVRQAEPQPALPREIQKYFSGRVRFLGNPALVNIEGVNILAYHGRSIDDFVTHVQQCTYEAPMVAMKEMLKRRHLAPVYGGRTPIAPEAHDYLVVETIPDVFVTGHVHGAGVEQFRGSLLINASAWQAQTRYQKLMNFVPDPAKVPTVNLRDLSVKVMDFAG